LNLLLELAERTSVGRFVLLKELEDLLDSLRAQLLVNSIEIGRLISPEVNLSDGVRVLSVLKSHLGVSLEHRFDLLSPVDNGSLKKDSFVFAGGGGTGGDVIGWKREESSSLDLSDGDVSVGQEDMELVHEILGDEIGPPNHVDWVSKDWHEDLVTDLVKIVHDSFVDLHEDDLTVDV